MSRDSCVTHLHQHVGQCRDAGYANGRADALDEVLQRGDDGNEFGPENYLLLVRIVAEVRANG